MSDFVCPRCHNPYPTARPAISGPYCDCSSRVTGGSLWDARYSNETSELTRDVQNFQERINTLEEALRTTRWHVEGIFGASHPVIVAIDKALSEGKETTEEPKP